MKRRLSILFLITLMFSGDLAGSNQNDKGPVVIQEQPYTDSVARS